MDENYVVAWVRPEIAATRDCPGVDATNKWPGETNREWGVPIEMDAEVKKRVDELWSGLGI